MNLYSLELVLDRLPPAIANLLRRSFVCYVIGGCIAACVHLIIVALLVELLRLEPRDANSIGFVIGVMINYCYQRKVTFRRTARKHAEQFPLFLGFALIGLGINRFVYDHSISDFHMHYLVAVAFAILVVFIFNFVANTLVTFRHKP